MPIEDRVRDAVEAYLARVRQDMDAHAGTLTADILRAVTETPAHERLPQDSARRLLSAVHRLDEAKTLSGTFDVLLQVVAIETPRAALLLVNADRVIVWGHRGFAAGLGPFDMPVGASDAMATAIRTGQPSTVQPRQDGQDGDPPAFMHVPAGSTGVVVPLAIAKVVVAVLYADDVGRESGGVWTDAVELVARHASTCLEKVTSVRTVELMSRPADNG